MTDNKEHTPKINTLINDIYNLFEVPHEPSQENLDRMTAQIEEEVRKALTEDPGDISNRPYLRMSSIGKPERQLWYTLKLESKKYRKKFKPDQLLKFLYGHILEAIILFLAREAGHTVEFEQSEVDVAGVKGHIDAVIDGVLTDVKSASRFAYPKFSEGKLLEDGQDPFGYIAQLSGYTQALGKKHGAFLAINKDTGQLTLLTIPKHKMINAEEKVERLKTQLEKDTPPPKCFESEPQNLKQMTRRDGSIDWSKDNGNRVLHQTCNYCPFKTLCWSDSNGGEGLRVFDYSQRPQFFTHVSKRPRVDEITNEYFGYTEDEILVYDGDPDIIG